MTNEEPPIDEWTIIRLYSAAYKTGSWLEVVSLGYTMLEMSLLYLLRSKAGADKKPVPEERLNKCRYLMDFANLALQEDFLPQGLFNQIDEFNQSRIRGVHHLLSGTVKRSELIAAGKKVGPLYGAIQRLWLPYTVGPAQKA